MSGSMLLTVLLGCSMVCAVLRERVAGPIRGVASYAVVPPGDGAMYLIAYFRDRIQSGSARRPDLALGTRDDVSAERIRH